MGSEGFDSVIIPGVPELSTILFVACANPFDDNGPVRSASDKATAFVAIE